MVNVAFTRHELRPADMAVVVDALRATTTATQALASGYRRVLCAETIELAHRLWGPGRVLAGERRCVKPPGFDQGNSPTEALECRGDELVLATTNGAPTIVATAKRARRVLLGSLLNLDAVIGVLGALNVEAELDVEIVCSGTDGAVALEDVYVAGRISAALPGERTDAARVAEAVARAFAAPIEAFAASADAAVLKAANLASDIAFCARESELEVVPAVLATGDGVATVAALDRESATVRCCEAIDVAATVRI